MIWEIDREHEGLDPVRLTLGEAVVFLNRVGLTVEEARSHRAPFEVEALLMSQLAEREEWRRLKRGEEPIVPNPDGEAAPAWVDSLPVEEG